MRTVLGQLISAATTGRVALARVIDARGPGPCPPGTAMIITSAREIIGCLSGGCIDADVAERAHRVIADGIATTMWFGPADDPLDLRPSLMCGGEIEVFVEPVDADAVPFLRRLEAALDEGAAADWVTELGPRPTWLSTVDATAAERTFVQHFPAAARMILCGANAFVESLSSMAIPLDYRVTVVDARSTFATAARFPGAEVIVDWPQRHLAAELAGGRVDDRTVVCVMSHDERFDVPTLRIALESAVGFVGALGSRRTDRARRERLHELGVCVTDLDRLHSPLGLDLNAHTPAQTAVSILAQIISETHGGTAMPLQSGFGAIHRRAG